ncbi:YhcN/YlaJ family sporulation lipoprotein [Paenibacillus sp. D2_2]|uniref:YhcN/YlaJ family sporulation lipoprotein n=1 Tax=Paenibacillus sp. D2_2 TaxID=3073092 RepID=UPI00281651C5|nr:YhcN/YlaJ family sporulation lipoprotein [Paenibacillus sp. D2_2]WMT42420.1 YhcN/YlaJ family sporulation lipoprotein [Paenibacillus sp. D2_2]
MRIWLCLLLTASLLTSCQTASKKASPSPKNQSENTTRTQSVQRHGPKGLSNTTGKAAQNNKSNTGKATGKNQQKNRQAHLESLAKQVPGVKGAHCVIMGKTAVVGIDVDGNLERARVGGIKYTVAEALRKDPQGTGAIVTADMDLSHRIAEIGKKTSAGHPISGFATEMADIIGRIVPQMSSDTHPRTKSVPAKHGKHQPTKQEKSKVKSKSHTSGTSGSKY